jgi:(R)-amidase
MRVALASIACEKGVLPPNGPAHVHVLDEAAERGCALAVFPEMSLTGSVDPTRFAARTVSLDDPAIEEVVAATARTGVAALFGVAERDGDRHHITQVLAAEGRVLAVQRKRFVAPDERGFTAGDDSSRFDLDGTSMATLICYEGGVDAAWDAVAALQPAVVWWCSAPGLFGRRIDDDAWRRGFDWWLHEALAGAREQAKRHGVWVGMVTQAGSTIDEDFPGLSALVDPTGHVVARSTDWRPGVLVVDVP